MARKKKHAEHVNHERWLISYADFITLLFAFFVVMFAVSQVDSKKVGRFQDSFSLAVGLSNDKGYLPRVEAEASPISASMLPLRDIEPPDPKKHPPPPPIFPDELAELQRLLEAKKALEESLAGVKILRRGNELVLRLDATALFDSGDERVKQESIEALHAIAEQVRDRAVQVRVEGHTDDVPIRTARFRSNWDLSTARATSVVSQLVKKGEIEPGRVAAIGYAEFQPIAPNDGPENRAKNRRVDFVLSVLAPIAAEEPVNESRPTDDGTSFHE